ncbi:hypothetical protein VNO80_27758 [Phaseolus coccineus]|uniref:Uncharacterized protein n=1 Tax=Phaseolus coccineus TaxID=3886 RepID=A0AAN9QHP2_PHACN
MKEGELSESSILREAFVFYLQLSLSASLYYSDLGHPNSVLDSTLSLIFLLQVVDWFRRGTLYCSHICC